MNKSSYIDRLIDEYKELIKKIEALENFLTSDKIKTVDEIEQDLLKEQCTYMINYLIILNKRISMKNVLFDSKLPNSYILDKYKEK